MPKCEPNTPDVFWDWFAETEPDIRSEFNDLRGLSINAPEAEMDAAMDKANALMTRLAKALHTFDKRIHPFGGIAQDGVIELIFTAEGNTAVFPRVFELVGKAPRLDGWRFVPLKPPQPQGGVQAKGITLDFGSVDYLLAREDGETDVLLIVDHDVEADIELFDFLAHLVIEAQLGEYGYAMHLDTIAISNRAEIDSDWLDDAKPVSMLADEFPKELPN